MGPLLWKEHGGFSKGSATGGRPGDPTPGCVRPGELETRVPTKTRTRLLRSGIMCDSQEGETALIPPTGKWLHRAWYIQTMELHSAIKRNEP